MNKEKAFKAIIFSIVGNALLAALKATVGILGNSFALIADAIESTGDIFSSILVWLGLKISTKPADKEHPFGHGKVEPLFTFIVVAFLVIAAVIIARQAIINSFTPHELPKPYTLIFLAVIILTKEFYYRFVNRKSKETKSTSLKADAWHHRSDAITSLAVFIGISIALIFGKGFEKADDYAALFASFIILFNAYLIFRPALGELLDEQKYEELIKEIKSAAKTVYGVIDTEKCYIRKFGMNYFVDIHLVVDSNKTVAEGHKIAHELKKHIKKEFNEIEDVFTHVEPSDFKANNE